MIFKLQHLMLIIAIHITSYEAARPSIWMSFTRVSPANTLEYKQTAQSSICEDLFPETKDVIRQCSCELSCTQWKVCCIDTYWKHLQPISLRVYIRKMTPNMVNASFYIPTPPPRTDLKPILSEEFLEIHGLPTSNITKVPMVTQCLKNATETENILCNTTIGSADFYTPVYVLNVNKTNSFYRNKYCAKCNNVYKYNITQLQIDCPNKQNKTIADYSIIEKRINSCRITCFSPNICRLTKGPGLPMSWHVIFSIKRNLKNVVIKEKVRLNTPGNSRIYYRLYCPSHEVINFTSGMCISLNGKTNETILTNATILTNETVLTNETYLNQTYTIPTEFEYQVVYKWQKIWDDTNAHISLVGSLFSVCCYIGLLLLFISKGIKSLPVSKLIMLVLWSTLLISDVLLLLTHFTEEHYLACKITAIALHYTLLLSSFVAAIFAFEIAKTFSGTMRKRLTKRKTFYIYVFTALILSAIVIATSVLLEEFDVFDMAYGDDKICWIGNFYGRIGLYLLPVVTIYLVSIIAIVFAIRNIQTVKNGTEKTMKKKESYSTKKIALKLMIYLGVVELIGIIQIEKDVLSEGEEIFNAVFATLYVVARSLKGLFMCALFIANPRTFIRQSTLSRSTKSRQ